jgi:integrase
VADEKAGILRLDSTGALAEAASAADVFAEGSRAPNTRRAYRFDLEDYEVWCRSMRLDDPRHPETVRSYVAALARPNGARKQAPNGCKVSTIMRRLSAIAWAATTAGYSDPTKDPRVRDIVAGIRRMLRIEPERKKPLTIELVRELVATFGDSLHDRRDRALVLLGLAGGLRRSELVGLDVEHLVREPEGIVAHLPRSKTDQEGRGRDVAIPYGRNGLGTCPIRAYEEWVAAASIVSGPIFRPIDRHGNVGGTRLSTEAVAEIVKLRCAAIGIDDVDVFAGHSLRSGFVTSAARGGASLPGIMTQTGHQSVEIVRGYIRRTTIWDDAASLKVGL